MIPDISVILPTIRVHLLEAWYESLVLSCPRHKLEVVCCGPFDPPSSLLELPNFTFIRSFASPTVCAQLCAIEARGEYLFHAVDDALFYPSVVSDELDIADDHVVGMRYNEGGGHSGTELPEDRWLAEHVYDEWKGIGNSWKLCGLFLMKKGIFVDFGGFDCVFQYLSNAITDLLFRVQLNSSDVNFSLSKRVVCSVDHMPNISGDHKAMHIANSYDIRTFESFWKDTAGRNKISLNNYQRHPEIWNLRFTGTEKKYGDLV